MPSRPFSLLPSATRSPLRMLRFSTTSSLPSGLSTTLESIRLSSASLHSPFTLKYSGNIDVLWKYSGATPSLSAASKVQSGALASSGTVKSGALYSGILKFMFFVFLLFYGICLYIYARVATITAFIVWSLFSASSNTTEFFPENTSSVTSLMS